MDWMFPILLNIQTRPSLLQKPSFRDTLRKFFRVLTEACFSIIDVLEFLELLRFFVSISSSLVSAKHRRKSSNSSDTLLK